MTVRVFGIRHHGPGSARALASTLRRWRPDAVLIEGPPEAAGVLGLAADPGMRPPVALLGYLPGQPAQASFWPMAAWSPEWVALRHALAAGAEARMIDLPVAAFLHQGRTRGDRAYEGDPLSRLAEAAGYDDTERWWEDVVEHRGEEEPWEAITEAMAEMRAQQPGTPGSEAEFEAQREAAMRRNIRSAAKVFERVAVVCGAWHAPALTELGPARADQELLRGLTREKATVTWVPWTNQRLSTMSGYGAGVTSPGWYGHLFISPDRPVERWMVRVAGMLRDERVDTPPSSVIDAVRLAETLAVLRGRPLAGLSECTDAARAALAGGYDQALELIGRKLVVGDVIGAVPVSTPMVALASDLAAQQRRLRLKAEPGIRYLDLDLRREVDLGRSRLLHRLDLLSIPWGVVERERRGTGTFREEWSIGWEPELSVRVVEAAVYGTTVESAATARAVELAGSARSLPEVTELIERSLLSDLPGAVGAVMAALDARAAVSTDVNELMEAVPPVARTVRYGTVRRTDTTALEHVVRGLVARVCVSVGPACASLDDEAAEAMARRVGAFSGAVASLDEPQLRESWFTALGGLSRSPAVHGLVAGRAARLLLDAGRVTAAEVANRLSAALSRAAGPTQGASWVEGLVASASGLLLVHDRALLIVIDDWLGSVPEEAFAELVPLLRRAFADFQPAERRMIGQAAAGLGGDAAGGAGAGAVPAARTGASVGGAGPGSPPAREPEIDHERAAAVLPLLRKLLG